MSTLLVEFAQETLMLEPYQVTSLTASVYDDGTRPPARRAIVTVERVPIWFTAYAGRSPGMGTGNRKYPGGSESVEGTEAIQAFKAFSTGRAVLNVQYAN